MSGPAFVYTELQLAVPFASSPWETYEGALRRQPGLRNKTWLAGVGNDSVGGFYEFDNLEHARSFVTGYFPDEAREIGVPQTTRIFDKDVTEAASRDMGSVHFGGTLPRWPEAFVYTEVQLGVPFADAPWRALNPILKAQPGLMAKTWLAGIGTNSLGGLYAFDSLANARAFALDYFPTETRKLGAAYTTRLFDAAVVAEASRPLSPFFS